MKWNTNYMLSIVDNILPTNINRRIKYIVGDGGHWTDEIMISIPDPNNKSEEWLILGAFNENEDCIDNTNDIEITHLYLYDSSGDGLNNTRDNKVREAYFIIKDHFTDQGYEVVSNSSNYF